MEIALRVIDYCYLFITSCNLIFLLLFKGREIWSDQRVLVLHTHQGEQESNSKGQTAPAGEPGDTHKRGACACLSPTCYRF